MSVTRHVALSSNSVFPAEACDILGGEFCGVQGVGKEVVLPPSATAQKVEKSGGWWGKKPDVGVVDYENSAKT